MKSSTPAFPPDRSLPSAVDQALRPRGKDRHRARVAGQSSVASSMPGQAQRLQQRAPRRPKQRRGRLLPKLLSIGAMLGVGALFLVTSVPANALLPTSELPLNVATAQVAAQSLQVGSSSALQSATRDGYTVVSLIDQERLRYADPHYAYSNDPNGTIQWPFPVQVPISSGFGPRISPCSGCSSYHEGVDFTPGAGSPIGAISAGVVSLVDTTGALGWHVVVDHVINGQNIQSVYGHMLAGSIRVTVGQQVKVTDELGQVGSTGESTGAHLHLEVHVNGTPVDPFAWLKANAN